MLLDELFAEDLDEALSDRARRTIGAGLLGAGLMSGAAASFTHWGDHTPRSSQSAATPAAAARYYDDGDEIARDYGDPAAETAVKAPSRQPAASGAPAERHANYPQELVGREGKDLKSTFVDIVLPLVQQQNADILKLRRKVEALAKKPRLSPQEQDWVDGLMKTYRIQDNDMETLIGRIDIVPPSLALAQAAVESGWGTSRYAQEANALYGQKTTAANAIRAREDGTPYAVFDHFGRSIESYMRNINSHPAYKKLRAVRHHYRQKGRPPQGMDLLDHLGSYSTKGDGYITQVRDMIRNNGFDQFDAKPTGGPIQTASN